MLDGVYCWLDCLDGEIGEKYLTAEELSNALYGRDKHLTEHDIKLIAADYEAELHKYVFKDGQEIEHKQLTRLMW